MDERRLREQEQRLPANNIEAYSLQQPKKRLNWVDCAKGICIIMVVMLHSTHGVENAVGSEGFTQYVVAFSKPFRMPDFFLISGLFLARVINRNWRSYLDSKVVHFAYFYALWVTIHFTVKTPGIVLNEGPGLAAYLYLRSFIQPFGTLWFIYLLPIFFITTKLLRRVNPVLIFAIAAALEIAAIETGFIIVDQFAERFIYFYAGYRLAPKVFAMAAWTQAKPLIALLCLAGWAIINGGLVFLDYADKPFVSLFLGFIGAAAIITTATLLVKVAVGEPVRYCGQNSIVIYLAFFLPMHTTQIIMFKTGIIANAGWMVLIATAAGIIGSLILWRLVRNTRLGFLFKRPSQLYLETSPIPQPSLARNG